MSNIHTVNVTPTTAPTSYKQLSTQWNRNLEVFLESVGIYVQVRTLDVVGVRGIDVPVSMNTLGIEIEGIDTRKYQQRILAYIREFFVRYPQGRIRKTGSGNIRPFTVKNTSAFPGYTLFPLTEIAVKF